MKLEIRMVVEVLDATSLAMVGQLKSRIGSMVAQEECVYAVNSVTAVPDVDKKQLQIRELAEERRQLIASGLKKAVRR